MQGFEIDENVGQGDQMRDRAAITYFGTSEVEGLAVAIDAFAGGALGVDGVIEWPVAIQQDALQAAALPIEVFDTATSFGELSMRTRQVKRLREQERTAEALRGVAS